jgi:hypothetical protein
VFSSCSILLSCAGTCFANLYPGLSFQVTIVHIGFCCLRSLMMPCTCSTLRIMLMYFHLLFFFIVIVLMLFFVLLMFNCDVM